MLQTFHQMIKREEQCGGNDIGGDSHLHEPNGQHLRRRNLPPQRRGAFSEQNAFKLNNLVFVNSPPWRSLVWGWRLPHASTCTLSKLIFLWAIKPLRFSFLLAALSFNCTGMLCIYRRSGTVLSVHTRRMYVLCIVMISAGVNAQNLHFFTPWSN